MSSQTARIARLFAPYRLRLATVLDGAQDLTVVTRTLAQGGTP